MTHVLIPDYPIRLQFQNGATPASSYAFNFTFFQNSDIHVWIDGVPVVEGVNYTVAGNPGTEGGFAGGVITMTPNPNTLVTIARSMAIDRVSDFPDAGSFNRRTLNTTLDKHVAMIQQVDERVDRTLQFPITDPPIQPFPPAAQRAGKVLSFDLSGNPVALIPGWPATLYPGYVPMVDGTGTTYTLLHPLIFRDAIQAQPLDATLTGLAALTIQGFQVPIGVATDTFATITLNNYSINLIAKPDAPSARTHLGLGTMATQNANAVNITGGTISGVAVAVPGLGTMSTQNANAVAITGGTINGLPTPVGFSEAATKGYADALAFGVNKRSTARVASTANLTVSGIVNGSVIDGVTVVAGDRVLVKDQTLPAQNGVYVVTGPGLPVRASDFDTYDECPGSLVTVQEGTVNADQVWLCTSNAGGVLETTAIDFSKVKVSPDLPLLIGQGGTGQITALAAFNALKQLATSAYQGVIQLATQAEVNAGADAVKAVTPATLYASPISPTVTTAVNSAIATSQASYHGLADCRFEYLDTNWLVLRRFGGSMLSINGTLRTVPDDTSVAINYGSVAGGVFYWIYATWSGSAITLFGDTVAPIRAGPHGMMVHSGNYAVTCVGGVIGGQAQFYNTQSAVTQASLYNKRQFNVFNNLPPAQTGSTARVALYGSVIWPVLDDTTCPITYAGYGNNNSGSVYNLTEFIVNGSIIAQQLSHSFAAGVGINPGMTFNFGCAIGSTNLMQLMGSVNAGIGTWYGTYSVSFKG